MSSFQLIGFDRVKADKIINRETRKEDIKDARTDGSKEKSKSNNRVTTSDRGTDL